MGELGGAGGALATAPTPTAGRGGAAHPTARSSPAPPLPPPTNPALRSKLDLTRSHPFLIRDRPSRPCPARSPREVWGRIRPPTHSWGWFSEEGPRSRSALKCRVMAVKDICLSEAKETRIQEARRWGAAEGEPEPETRRTAVLERPALW